MTRVSPNCPTTVTTLIENLIVRVTEWEDEGLQMEVDPPSPLPSPGSIAKTVSETPMDLPPTSPKQKGKQPALETATTRSMGQSGETSRSPEPGKHGLSQVYEVCIYVSVIVIRYLCIFKFPN